MAYHNVSSLHWILRGSRLTDKPRIVCRPILQLSFPGIPSAFPLSYKNSRCLLLPHISMSDILQHRRSKSGNSVIISERLCDQPLAGACAGCGDGLEVAVANVPPSFGRSCGVRTGSILGKRRMPVGFSHSMGAASPKLPSRRTRMRHRQREGGFPSRGYLPPFRNDSLSAGVRLADCIFAAAVTCSGAPRIQLAESVYLRR
jgi:hypothetical protein